MRHRDRKREKRGKSRRVMERAPHLWGRKKKKSKEIGKSRDREESKKNSGQRMDSILTNAP